MGDANGTIIDSHFGRKKTDVTGAPVGVTRMVVDKSYANIGGLLQEHINEDSQRAPG